MRVRAVMTSERDDFQGAADLASLRIVKHFVLGRAEIEVVGGFLQIREVRERYANAILHEVSRLHFLLRRDEVQSAALIVFAPAAPVREFLLPTIHLLD